MDDSPKAPKTKWDRQPLKRFGELSWVMDELDLVVAPFTQTWAIPGSAVAAWIACHFTAFSVYSIVLIASTDLDDWLRTGFVLVWMMFSSRTCWQIAKNVTLTSGGTTNVNLPRRLDANSRLSLFVVGTGITYFIAGPLGPGAQVGFVAFVVVTFGLRVAGVRAWRKILHEPWAYVRAVLSLDALLLFGIAALTAATVLTAASLVVDPFVLDETQRGFEDLLQAPFGRRDQFRTLMIGLALFTGPSALVCEVISSASRHEERVNERMIAIRTAADRLYISASIHDDDRSLVKQLLESSTSPEQVPLLYKLKHQLEQLQHAFEEPVAKSVNECLKRSFAEVDDRGLEITADYEDGSLQQILCPRSAQLFQRVALNLVANTADAGTTRATWKIWHDETDVVLEYFDDGPRYDVDAAISAGGCWADSSARSQTQWANCVSMLLRIGSPRSFDYRSTSHDRQYQLRTYAASCNSGACAMYRIAIIEDIPVISSGIKAALLDRDPIATIETFDRPRRLDPETLDEWTHAIVDLSFGRDNLDADTHGVPEVETGLDAIDLIRQRNEKCAIAVQTILDRPLLELAVAIRQTWPEIPLYHKQHSMLHEQLQRFVFDGEARDNPAIKADLNGVAPLDPRTIFDALHGHPSRTGIVRVLLALARSPSQPTTEALGEELNYAPQTIHNRVNDAWTAFRDAGVPTPSDGGLSALWLWAHARRAILYRLLS